MVFFRRITVTIAVFVQFIRCWWRCCVVMSSWIEEADYFNGLLQLHTSYVSTGFSFLLWNSQRTIKRYEIIFLFCGCRLTNIKVLFKVHVFFYGKWKAAQARRSFLFICLFVSLVTSCLEASKQFRRSVENVNKIPAKFSLDRHHDCDPCKVMCSQWY